jgi:hypothetical protein
MPLNVVSHCAISSRAAWSGTAAISSQLGNRPNLARAEPREFDQPLGVRFIGGPGK